MPFINNIYYKLDTIGTSHEGRPIIVLKLCYEGKCGRKPIYWMDSAIHPREWIGPAVTSYFIQVYFRTRKDRYDQVPFSTYQNIGKLKELSYC